MAKAPALSGIIFCLMTLVFSKKSERIKKQTIHFCVQTIVIFNYFTKKRTVLKLINGIFVGCNERSPEFVIYLN